MTGLTPILRLRALRETRATRTAALARAQFDTARTAQADAHAAIAAHDDTSARTEERLHDAMLAQGFTLTDLRHADDRAFQSAARRDELTAHHKTAEDAATDASDLADRRGAELRLATRRHEKLCLAAQEYARRGATRAEAIAEDEDAAAHG